MTALELAVMLKIDNPAWDTPFVFISTHTGYGGRIYFHQFNGPYDMNLGMGSLYEPWEVGQLLGGN